MSTPDRAELAVGLAERLRGRGVAADLAGVASLARALDALPVLDPSALYWAARLTLVHRAEDLAVFDEVMAGLETRPTLRSSEGVGVPVRRPPAGSPYDGPPLPWLTPRARASAVTEDGQDAGHGLPLRRPSGLDALLEAPFETLTPAEVAQLGRWLAEVTGRWPRRRSRRRHPDRRGTGVALRATMARARRTGWEPVDLVALRRTPRPRKVVVLCDVSRSMQAEVAPLLHLMRALAILTGAEVFTFGTVLTRLTTVLARGGVDEAVAAAGARAADRFGGTRIAASLRELLVSRYEPALRGAIVLIASDGWDSDPPPPLAEAMSRLHRRAHRVVWANPRAGVPGFEPRVATMAAALPYCDELVPVASFADLRRLLERVAAG